MPWDISDVDKHVKGLSDGKKKAWVKIANNALKTCLSAAGFGKAGDRAECDGKAIRTANAMVKKLDEEALDMLSLGLTDALPAIRLGEADGRPPVLMEARGEITDFHIDEETGVLTANVVISQEGVLPYYMDGRVIHELIPGDELASPAFLASINGKPVTRGHPSEKLVTMDTLSKYAVGVLHNGFRAVQEDGIIKVKGKETIWDPVAIEKVEDGSERQVSIGRWTMLLPETGEHNGQRYDYRQTELRLNHLAHTARGRQGDACRVLVDMMDASEAELARVTELPLTQQGDNLKEIAKREIKKGDSGMLEAIGWAIQSLRRRLEQAVKVAKGVDGTSGKELAAALAVVKKAWPDLKYDEAALDGATEKQDINPKAGDTMGDLKMTFNDTELLLSAEGLSDEERTGLESNIQTFQSEIDKGVQALKDVAAFKGSDVAQLTVERDQLKTDLAEAGTKLATAEKNITDAGDGAEGLRDELKALKKEVADSKAPSSSELAQIVHDEVMERTKLVAAIQGFDSLYKADGVLTPQLRRDLLTQLHPESAKDLAATDEKGEFVKNDVYVASRVDFALELLEEGGQLTGSFGSRNVRPSPQADGARETAIAKGKQSRLNMYKGG